MQSAKLEEARYSRLSRWSKPEIGWAKVNMDVSVVRAGKLRLKIIVRNDEGVAIWASSIASRGCADIGFTKVTTLFHGVRTVKSLGSDKVLFESDSLLIVQAVQGQIQLQSEMAFVIKEIRSLLQGFKAWGVSHIYKEVNGVAHYLASERPNGLGFGEWLFDFPDDIVALAACETVDGYPNV